MKFIFYYLVSIIVFLYTTVISGFPPVTNTKVIIVKTSSSNGRPPMRGRSPSPKRRRSPSPKRGRFPSPRRG
ncbi:Hypothetical protein SRAE_0000009100 [Strongyloides ratti]|uniref:Uncharacterized protein n=1 Tax=Strongyloides ratti TaxID=34506 RepID=A0A090L0D2_STRRB|nr:Hypothetical protein SRAE_0000009100 [Strongyloides ratti]CEF60959.1 Hypothetical protein SRAE_0000009100 [Strongyloides ratti]